MTEGPEFNGKPLRPNIMAVLFHPYTLDVFVGRINNTTGRFSHKYSPVEGGTDNQLPYIALHREMAEEIGADAPRNVVFVAAFDRTIGYLFKDHDRHGGKEEAVAFYLARPSLVQSINLNPGLTTEAPAFHGYNWVNPKQAREFLKMGADHQRRRFVECVADGTDEVWYALRASIGIRSPAHVRRPLLTLEEVAQRAQHHIGTLGSGYTLKEANIPVPCNQSPVLASDQPRVQSLLTRAARRYILRNFG